jgi:O-antigen/teichoic acid export membrane protein
MADQARTGQGLRTVLLATVIAGGIGYLIQALVPPLLTQSNYLIFTTFWSATYLIVSCLAGVQQELTRASRFGPNGDGLRVWQKFTATTAITAAVVVLVVFLAIGGRIFPSDTLALVAAISVAAFGYCLIAAVSGALYGVQDWCGVGGMTVADSLIRAAALGVALLLGGTAALMGWAIAVPFLLAVVLIWAWRGRRISDHLQLDVGLSRLFRNTSATLLASLATGALISGLPLLLRALVPDAGEGLLASSILVISLTRAPLVVPLVALQGYLLVQFRENRRHSSVVLLWIGALLVVVAVLSGLAAWLGPVIMDMIYPRFEALTGTVFAAVVASAGLTGVLCITGPALLASNRHRWYVAGWLLSAIVTVAVLVAPGAPEVRILVALVAAPIAGAAVHATGLARTKVPSAISPQA